MAAVSDTSELLPSCTGCLHFSRGKSICLAHPVWYPQLSVRAEQGQVRVLIPCQCSPSGGGKLLSVEIFVAVVQQQLLAHMAPGIQQESSRELVLPWSLQEHYRYLPWKEVFKAVVFAAQMLCYTKN